MHILGSSAMGHDPAAALLSDNGIIAAIEEGKLARTRSIEGIARAAMHFCWIVQGPFGATSKE